MVGPRSHEKTTMLQFGSASLSAPTRKDEWARNLGLSHRAVEKVEASVRKPGVKLRIGKSTPNFRADPTDPTQLMRVLDGKEERGVFVDGVFQVSG